MGTTEMKMGTTEMTVEMKAKVKALESTYGSGGQRNNRPSVCPSTGPLPSPTVGYINLP